MPTQKIQFVLLVIGCWLPFTESAAVALTQYTMDQRASCISAGYLDIPRGQTTIVQGPSKDTATATQVLSCRLQFSAQTEGDTLKMTLDSSSFFEDCDVSLELQMEGSDKIIRGCKSGSTVVPTMAAVNGKASVWLSRKQYDDVSYWFQVTITAVRTELQGANDSASQGDVGQIVGISVGVIAFVVIVIIIIICCYRRRRGGEKAHANKGHNDTVDNSLSTNVVHGYENNMAKIGYEDSFHQSPGSDRKLLGQNYPGSGLKSKSALERFGDSSSHTEKPDLVNRPADVTKQRDRQQTRDFGRKGRNLGQDVDKDIPKQKVAEERVERTSDHSSLTDSSSLASSSKPLRTPKSFPVSKSSPKSSRLQKQGSSQPQLSSSSEVSRYKSEENDDRYIKINKNSDLHDKGREKSLMKPEENDDRDIKISKNSDMYDTSREKSQRKPEEKKKRNVHDDYGNDDTVREKGIKGGKKSHTYHSEEDDDSDKIEETYSAKKAAKSEHDGRSRSRENGREHEGRFKKSASGRNPKNKGPKMARSKSAGNALEDLYSDDPKVRSKSTGSVRSLSVVDDDDDDYDLDSNYMPFRRSGSKTSLYASRSSLYGRRRKNSMGETLSMSSYALSSYIHDDLDSRVGDFDHTALSLKEKERLFKSTGDLNVSSAVIVRECATQTGSNKEVYIYGKKTVSKIKRRKRFNRGTQTTRDRRDSAASERSARSVRSNQHLKSRSRSKESLNKKRRTRSRDLSDDNISETSNHRRHPKHRNTDDSDSEDEQYHRHIKSNHRDNDTSDRHKKRSRSKSKERSNFEMNSKHRDRDHSESEDEQSHYSSKSYDTNSESTGKKKRQPQSKSNTLQANSDYYQQNQNSQLNLVPGGSANFNGNFAMTSGVPAPSVNQFGQHIPQFLPTGYPMVIQQPTAAFMSTDQNGLPIMIPVASIAKRPIPPKPSIPAKPDASKWDQLVNLTEGMKKRRHQMGESLETESVLSSSWSQPHVYHSDHMYGPRYGQAYDPATSTSEYNVGQSKNYSTTDSNV